MRIQRINKPVGVLEMTSAVLRTTRALRARSGAKMKRIREK